MRIDAKGLHYKELNDLIRRAVNSGKKEIILNNVNGQRYIGTSVSKKIRIIINGVPGNDLAAFMDGPDIIVNANVQDAAANTMNAGRIIVHGGAGDLAGHSMRGGTLYIKGNAGYRVGIHMKSFKDLYPVVIIGGAAGDFLGEYMAGGLIVVLGLNRRKGEPIVGEYCGTGMHEGVMYIRGNVEGYQLGKEVGISDLEGEDKRLLRKYLKDYCSCFSFGLEKVMRGTFKKVTPRSRRPYGRLYAY